MKLLIADDEYDVREGIRYLLDWSKLGMYICGEGKNGQDTLNQIIKLQPDIVLLDIRMPKMSGLEIVRRAKEQGFQGKFIILSGYSDFSYAQEAIRSGVSCYLLKPVDEEELEQAVIEAKNTILDEQNTQKKMIQYRTKARDSILKDILYDRANYQLLDSTDLFLDATVFQIVLYTNYNQDSFQTTWDFADILRIANRNHNSLDYINVDNRHIIILKGELALLRFQELVAHYISHPQKGSPLDSLFLTYGRPVYRINQIHQSFEDSCSLMKRRFFCHYNQHVLGYLDLPSTDFSNNPPHLKENTYSQRIADYIQSSNRSMLSTTMDELRQELYDSNADIYILKHYLSDILIQIKNIITRTYGNLEIPFADNTTIINTIAEKYYLYEIFDFFHVQFEICMNSMESPSRENVLDNILQYIDHNYKENLKLGSIADLFGYNSSYLGKIFSKVTGKSFNAYIDSMRIETSKELLRDNSCRIYEVAQKVGYSNVDYFHKKFKKYTGMSPAEYRRLVCSESALKD